MQIPREFRIIQWLRILFIGIGALAALLTAIAVLNLTSELSSARQDNKAIRQELAQANRAQECRFDINSEVESIASLIIIKQAQIFTTAIQSPPTDQFSPELQQLGEELQELIDTFGPATERRANAVKECNA